MGLHIIHCVLKCYIIRNLRILTLKFASFRACSVSLIAWSFWLLKKVYYSVEARLKVEDIWQNMWTHQCELCLRICDGMGGACPKLFWHFCEVWSVIKWKVRSAPLLSRERHKWHSSLHHSLPQNLSHSPCYISYVLFIPLQLSHQPRFPSVLMHQHGISENILALFRLQTHVCLSPFVHWNINKYTLVARLHTGLLSVVVLHTSAAFAILPCNVQIQ